MAYTINRTSGAVVTTVSDGTVDNTTSLTLVGKNYAGYGEFLNENYVKLLENFSNTTAPSGPLSGQLWWDSAEARLKAYTGAVWKSVQTSYTGGSTPTNAVLGDLWWDTTNGKLKVYDSGGQFQEVGGPGTSSEVGSTVTVETITDTLAQEHQIIRFELNSITVAIISRDATFTPSPAITGFTTIVPGMNLSSTIGGIQLTGKSSNAELLDNIDSTGFLRKNTAETTNATFAVLNDTGLSVGVDSDFSVSVTGSDVFLRNQTLNGDINLRVNRAGIATTVLNLDGATGNLFPGANNTYDMGSSSMRWSTIYATTFSGVANQALYADLAERFASDRPLPEGTVVKIGGEKEVTAELDDASEEVFGVVSLHPAYLMNTAAGEDHTHPAIAMTGRVPVRVVGQVRKGQRLISAGNGCARGAKPGEATAFNVIGRALADKFTDNEALVEAAVKLSA